MGNNFYGKDQGTEAIDEFDIDLRLRDGEQNRPSETAIISVDSNCSTCTHTSPRFCC
jgi:hypothetical protein